MTWIFFSDGSGRIRVADVLQVLAVPVVPGNSRDFAIAHQLVNNITQYFPCNNEQNMIIKTAIGTYFDQKLLKNSKNIKKASDCDASLQASYILYLYFYIYDNLHYHCINYRFWKNKNCSKNWSHIVKRFLF